MIAKHIAMHSVEKSSFAGLVNYITDNQSKDHRLGEVSITNCAAYDCRGRGEGDTGTQYPCQER